jgi:hypothetical protein
MKMKIVGFQRQPQMLELEIGSQRGGDNFFIFVWVQKN